MIWFEVAVVLVLILVNGYLALSELAVVSARKQRLQVMADEGSTGAAAALALAEEPGRFLSTVQIGLTLISVCTGAFGGATLAEPLAEELRELGVAASYASVASVAVVVACLTYLTLIFGELVPKQIALKRAEPIAAAVGHSMALLSRIASPAVSFLDISARVGLRLFGAHKDEESTVTEEEIKTLVAQAETAGVVEPAESEMIAGVMRLGDRSVKSVMTPRRDVEWLDLAASEDQTKARLLAAAHSRLLVAEGDLDSVSGIIEMRDLLAEYLQGQEPSVRDHIKQPPVVADTANLLDVLEILREATVHVALVVDEFGTFEGIVTIADIIEAITGELNEPTAAEDIPSAVQRDDGSWLLDGVLPADEMAETLDLKLPEEREYHTVAGYVLHEFARVPVIGETIESEGWRFEVVDMDGRRIDKVLASRLTAAAEDATQE